jgi:hypothetical protein
VKAFGLSDMDVLRQEFSEDTPQRWGFSIPYVATQAGQSLLVAQVPVWASRRWTIHLNAFRYQGGTITANILPPDNQTSQLVRARIQYGVDGAQEDISIDYPSRGCSIPVAGSIVRVYIDPPTEVLNTGIVPPPLLSGFLTPTDTARGAVGSIAPTFTTRIAALLFGTQQFVPIPRRAVGYRLAYGTDSVIGVPITVEQVAGQAGGADVAWDFGSANPLGQGEALAVPDGNISANRVRDVIPLMPQAGALRLFNNSIDTNQTIMIQFILDIG